ncbi:MAG: hypothetical protein U9R66_06060 [Thermodesulfobacteriota bacterium]|nr:hypothetical protein [Thermodesulfobacteriota bacterium]
MSEDEVQLLSNKILGTMHKYRKNSKIDTKLRIRHSGMSLAGIQGGLCG